MQIKVREATSNDPCGPTTHSMNEIASATFDEYLPNSIFFLICLIVVESFVRSCLSLGKD